MIKTNPENVYKFDRLCASNKVSNEVSSITLTLKSYPTVKALSILKSVTKGINFKFAVEVNTVEDIKKLLV